MPFRTDPGISAITHNIGKARFKMHDEIQLFLLEHIEKHLTSFINYDHLNLGMPRYNIPLNIDKHRFDISFILGQYLIFIEIKTRKLKMEDAVKFYNNGTF